MYRAAVLPRKNCKPTLIFTLKSLSSMAEITNARKWTLASLLREAVRSTLTQRNAGKLTFFLGALGIITERNGLPKRIDGQPLNTEEVRERETVQIRQRVISYDVPSKDAFDVLNGCRRRTTL